MLLKFLIWKKILQLKKFSNRDGKSRNNQTSIWSPRQCKILILHSSAILGTATHDIILRLLRGSTNIHNLNFWSDNSNYTFMTGAFQYLDSPSTTSATTYKTQVYKNQNDLLYNYVNEVTSKSTLTLMEIAQWVLS